MAGNFLVEHGSCSWKLEIPVLLPQNGIYRSLCNFCTSLHSVTWKAKVSQLSRYPELDISCIACHIWKGKMNSYGEDRTCKVYTLFYTSGCGLEWYLLIGFLLAVTTGKPVTGVIISQQHLRLILQIQRQHHIFQYQILSYFY